jgi:hypothetical protein
MTKMELSYMDYDLFFQDGNKVIHVVTGTQTFDEFLEVDEEDQEALFDYMNSLDETSKSNVKVNYPDTSSFTNYSNKGIFSYDCAEGFYKLASEPETQLNAKLLPKQIQNILPKIKL